MLDGLTAHDWLLVTGLAISSLGWWVAFRMVR